MKRTPKTKPGVVYHTWGHNIEGCLRKGSFVRTRNGEHAQYMNGDFMGVIDAIPAKMVEVSSALAEDLLPECCK